MKPFYSPLSRSRQFSRGMTLVELLVVVGVIGVLAAIAIMVLSHTNEAAQHAKNRRNAQTVATIYASAAAAGAVFTSPEGDVRAVISELAGGKSGRGILSNTVFTIPAFGAGEVEQFLPHLAYQPGRGGLIAYDPTP